MNTLYGTALEGLMLQEFIKEHSSENMELYVLRESSKELNLYRQNGFKLKKLVPGFNIHNTELPSALLERKGKN